MIKQNQAYLNRLHIFIDAVCIYLSAFLSHKIRFEWGKDSWISKLFFFVGKYELGFSYYQKTVIITIIILLLLYTFFGLYTPKRYQRGSREIVNLLKANLAGLGIGSVAIVLTKLQNFPRSLLLLFFSVNFIIGVLSRFTIRKVLNSTRESGRNLKHVVLVGFSTSAAAYIDRINKNMQAV